MAEASYKACLKGSSRGVLCQVHRLISSPLAVAYYPDTLQPVCSLRVAESELEEIHERGSDQSEH